jgi:hypothetical protein
MVTRRSDHPRSDCAINAAVQVIGDRWSLLVLRDVMFGNRRHFRILQIVEQWHRQGQVTDGTAVVRLAVKRPDRAQHVDLYPTFAPRPTLQISDSPVEYRDQASLMQAMSEAVPTTPDLSHSRHRPAHIEHRQPATRRAPRTARSRQRGHHRPIAPARRHRGPSRPRPRDRIAPLGLCGQVRPHGARSAQRLDAGFALFGSSKPRSRTGNGRPGRQCHHARHPPTVSRCDTAFPQLRTGFLGISWTRPGSNRPPPVCKTGALPDELRALAAVVAYPGRDSNAHCHRSGRCASCQLGYPGPLVLVVPCPRRDSNAHDRRPQRRASASWATRAGVPERGAASRHVDGVAQVVPASEPDGRPTRRSRPARAAAPRPRTRATRRIRAVGMHIRLSESPP